MRPNPFRRRESISKAYTRLGGQLIDAMVRGMTEEPTGTPEEQAEQMAAMFAHAEFVAHRSFGALYDDEDE